MIEREVLNKNKPNLTMQKITSGEYIENFLK